MHRPSCLSVCVPRGCRSGQLGPPCQLACWSGQRLATQQRRSRHAAVRAASGGCVPVGQPGPSSSPLELQSAVRGASLQGSLCKLRQRCDRCTGHAQQCPTSRVVRRRAKAMQHATLLMQSSGELCRAQCAPRLVRARRSGTKQVMLCAVPAGRSHKAWPLLTPVVTLCGHASVSELAQGVAWQVPVANTEGVGAP
jgi:hypothetical protein